MARRSRFLVTGMLAATMSLGLAGGAAALSPNASCVAVNVEVAGPPGLFQSVYRLPVFGQIVKWFALSEPGACPFHTD
jgi:hypothetical protein